jgi:hypothetical protein
MTKQRMILKPKKKLYHISVNDKAKKDIKKEKVKTVPHLCK